MIIIRIFQVIAFLAFASIMVWGARMTMWADGMNTANSAMLDNKDSSPDAKFVRPDNDDNEANESWDFRMPKMPWILRKLTRTDSDGPLGKGQIRRVPEEMGFRVEGKENELIFRPDDLNVTRVIKFTKTVPFEAFLNAGEERPVPEFEILYAKGRAGKMMAQYCREALGTVAKSCALLKVRVSDPKNGLYRIRAEFAYVPNYELGAFTNTSGYEALTATVRLNGEDSLRSNVANSVDARADAFRLVLTACAEFRAIYANCAITSLSMDMKPAKPETAYEKRRRLRQEKKKKFAKKGTFERKKSGFGEKGGFGKKAGFGQNKKAAGAKAAKVKPVSKRIEGETLSARTTIAVYALDTEDENDLVRALGKSVTINLLGKD